MSLRQSSFNLHYCFESFIQGRAKFCSKTKDQPLLANPDETLERITHTKTTTKPLSSV
jgi:hypothetical protein